jgi:hypothetical protein
VAAREETGRDQESGMVMVTVCTQCRRRPEEARRDLCRGSQCDFREIQDEVYLEFAAMEAEAGMRLSLWLFLRDRVRP